MILTCPRCATRYLVDPLKVWTEGRTVQCEACGQRWRAVGQGVRLASTTESPRDAEHAKVEVPEAAAPEAAAESEEPPRGETDPDESDTRATTLAEEPPPAAVGEAANAETAAPVEVGPAPATDPDLGFPPVRRDWHAAPPPEPPPAEPSPAAPSTSDEPPPTREFLFRKPPAPVTPSFGSRGSGVGRWLAIAFLVVIVLAAFVMFHDVIVQAFPGLAPIYAAMGLLVHPAGPPHG